MHMYVHAHTHVYFWRYAAWLRSFTCYPVGRSGFRVVSPTYCLYKSGSELILSVFIVMPVKPSTSITASGEEAAVVYGWCFSNSKGKNRRWLQWATWSESCYPSIHFSVLDIPLPHPSYANKSFVLPNKHRAEVWKQKKETSQFINGKSRPSLSE